jgi:hypothetical protein
LPHDRKQLLPALSAIGKTFVICEIDNILPREALWISNPRITAATSRSLEMPQSKTSQKSVLDHTLTQKNDYCRNIFIAIPFQRT